MVCCTPKEAGSTSAWMIQHALTWNPLRPIMKIILLIILKQAAVTRRASTPTAGPAIGNLSAFIYHQQYLN